jgi:hypothetical protein
MGKWGQIFILDNEKEIRAKVLENGVKSLFLTMLVSLVSLVWSISPVR